MAVSPGLAIRAERVHGDPRNEQAPRAEGEVQGVRGAEWKDALQSVAHASAPGPETSQKEGLQMAVLDQESCLLLPSFPPSHPSCLSSGYHLSCLPDLDGPQYPHL